MQMADKERPHRARQMPRKVTNYFMTELGENRHEPHDSPQIRFER